MTHKKLIPLCMLLISINTYAITNVYCGRSGFYNNVHNLKWIVNGEFTYTVNNWNGTKTFVHASINNCNVEEIS